MNEFEGRTVIVTGAGSGIGHEMAAGFARRGAAVFGGDLDPSGVPDGCTPIAVDVSSRADVEHLVASAATTGRIDVLCNNAGIGSVHDVLSCTDEEWDRVFDVNVKGTFLATRAVLPHMLNRQAGVIVNTASALAFKAAVDRAAYSASKGAIVALTRQVALQYARQGIRCACIAPGVVDSPWVGRLLAQADDPVAARAALVDRQPAGRLAHPREIAEAAIFLASDAASFVTGSAFVVDGGFSA